MMSQGERTWGRACSRSQIALLLSVSDSDHRAVGDRGREREGRGCEGAAAAVG